MKRYAGSLRDRITAGLEAGQPRRIGHSLFRTLDQLHTAGVIVKDIKPENVLMNEYDQPFLADFGLAVVVTGTLRIQPTSMKGTFNYMAPETFETAGHGAEVDIWAMACVVVEMCTGEMPFAGLQINQITRAVCDHRRVPDVPDHVPAAELIRRCFAFDPTERPSASELADALAPEAAALPEVVGGTCDSLTVYK